MMAAEIPEIAAGTTILSATSSFGRAKAISTFAQGTGNRTECIFGHRGDQWQNKNTHRQSGRGGVVDLDHIRAEN